VTQFVEVKTAELTGPALDWAVAIATRQECRTARYVAFGKAVVVVEAGLGESLSMLRGPFCPSTNWAQGGPLIDSYTIKVSSYPKEKGEGRAAARLAMNGKVYWQSGDTPLIAICRAIVAAALGDVVHVPTELVEVAS
jgi:hypothetical protein